ncbi:uncharacterized protein E0L32_012139 [Thyridium curvatum]|uniref:Thioredoxin domain-containing protein n=1 Tax=Thyridium curvatum TaxID=1093900 RepID=A0A507BE27_9PEZI|nr:uncharacterized protein E0L32_012139 [Thyridium curvatum]TPX17576.1 hypothetical protein E0L32_012139 [Thyridium curvatum]
MSTNSVSEILDIDDYHTELKKPGFLVIDFYSTQCPPCKVIAPFFEEIAAKTGNRDVRFFKVNGLEEPGTAVQKSAEVVWWPTIVVYNDGKEVWRGKVPNPPSMQTIKDLGKFLDERLAQ